jgi:hypothetical protein
VGEDDGDEGDLVSAERPVAAGLAEVWSFPLPSSIIDDGFFGFFFLVVAAGFRER